MSSATGAAVSTPIGIIVAMKSMTSTVARIRRAATKYVTQLNTTSSTRRSPPTLAPPWSPPANRTIASPAERHQTPRQGPPIGTLVEHHGADRHEQRPG